MKLSLRHTATVLICVSLAACAPITVAPTSVSPTPAAMPIPSLSPTPVSTATPAPTPTPASVIPNFKHIVMVLLENKEFGLVVNNGRMPYFNELARNYTLLTQHYAVAHPSLPNYLALIAGDTFGVTFDCTKCLQDAQTLPDLLEASGRTWKTYQEDMPSACFEGSDWADYSIKHNPFMYFNSIRLDSQRCQRSVVPLSQLYVDLAAGELPNFAFITPNLCNDAHDCGLRTTDDWLKALMAALLPALDDDGQPYLVVITWDEGQGDHSCCGLPEEAGGRIATILVSPQARTGFQDATPYTHYSLLKTISDAWRLPYLGHAADPDNVLITAPWK
jgi:phosphatidylinositol-3-phosphatase